MTQYLFTIPGVKLLLSERLNQDPLECFFGQQRQKGGGSDNPTVSQFIASTSSLRVQGSVSVQPLRGNCRRKRTKIDVAAECEPLPKRRRQ